MRHAAARGFVAGIVALCATVACSGDDTAPTTAAISPAASATAVGSTTVQPTDAAGSGSTTSTPRSSSSDQPPPPPAQEASIDWPLPGRDLDNSRAAIGSLIDSTDIARLQPAWEVELGGQLTTAPIVRDGVVYVADGAGGITAIELDSGDVVWATDPTGSNIGPFGVAVDDERVYGLDGSTGVVAVDRDTGDRVWSTTITTTASEGVDIQPLVVDGMVLVSTVPVSMGGIYVGGDRGVISALDAASGEVRWTFDTVADDLWGDPTVNSGGGAWYPPAVDPDNGLVYFGVANPAPFPGTEDHPNGSSRPGPNLYTDSVVALELGTGELRWYHQVHPHDLFDRDLVHTMIVRLADGRRVVVGTGKGGVVVGLDPDSGDLLWQTPVGHHENDDLEQLDGPTTVAPGSFGGVITPPATADGIVYTASLDAPIEYQPDATSYFGATLGQADGELTAVDADDGAVVWTVDLPGDPLGAATVVNDLVLTPLFDGTLLAFARADGHEVWRTSLAGGVNGWLSVTDDTLIVPVGLADPPRLVAYRLR